MAGRICVPIHDDAGQLVAYAGRWPGEPPEGVERYLLPKRFEKSRVLFNLHRVPRCRAPGARRGLLVGVPPARPWRARCRPDGLLGLRGAARAVARARHTPYVTALWDGDDAGRKARERALPALADAFFVRAPLLPVGEKPDTLPERALRELVDLA